MWQWTFWANQTLNALSFSMLLFTVSAGLSVTMGSMGVIDLAVGGYFLFGGYLGLLLIEHGANFGIAMLAVFILIGMLGGFIHRSMLERIHGDHSAQVLLTWGIVIIIADAADWIWGGIPRVIQPPDFLLGPAIFGDVIVPKYRLFLIGVGPLIALALWLVLERTPVGVAVRAAHDDPPMLQAVGIDVSRLWTATYAAGAGLAGAGGVLAGPLVALAPGLDLKILLLASAVITVGGPGTLLGTLIGSLTIGFVHTFGIAIFPSVALFAIFVPMAAILILKPKGLIVQ